MIKNSSSMTIWAESDTKGSKAGVDFFFFLEETPTAGGI